MDDKLLSIFQNGFNKVRQRSKINRQNV